MHTVGVKQDLLASLTLAMIEWLDDLRKHITTKLVLLPEGLLVLKHHPSIPSKILVCARKDDPEVK